MKKSIVLVSAFILVLGVAISHAEVRSKNAVGYVKVEIPGERLELVSTPFVNLDQSAQTLDDIFGTDLPDNTVVFVFQQGPGYTPYTYYDGDGWLDDDFLPAGDTVLERGDAFWVDLPAGSTNQTIFVMGEVPGDDLAPTNTVVVPEGLRLFSFAYPAELSINDVRSGVNPLDLDEIHVWDAEGRRYHTFTFYDEDGWLDDDFLPVDIILQPGRGYWYESGSATVWEQVKPYDWP